MDAEGCRVHAHRGAVGRLHHTLAGEAERAIGDLRGVVQQGAGGAARNERAIGKVPAVEEGLEHEGQSGGARGALDLAAQAEHGQRATEPLGEGRDRGDDRVRLIGVGGDRVVERTVRLDVADVGAGIGERVQLRGDGGA